MSFRGTVPTRRLGPAGPEVPVFALGSWNTWDRMEFDDAVALIRRAAEVGAAFFDVAHYNMGPHAENARTDLIFGEAVRAAGLARKDYLLCGKLWLWEYPTTSFASQMETSLSRIGIEKADTVVVGDYMSTIDVRQIVTDVAAEIAAGRFDSWGVNNWQAADITLALDFAEAEGLTPPTFAQLKYGLARRTMAEGAHYGELFRSGRLALQASDVFEGGILAGKLAPARKIGADVGGIREQIVAIYPELERIAAGLGATPTQLGIAFCLANPATANVLFGVSRLEQLEDNLGALELLDRVGAEEVRAATAGLWVDRGVNADGTW
ncbi:aldo/keto reductase [Microterricola viridarii]|uniref:Predicted oxidoreductase n=1 Tax=Microterricola viridarii TaxID=412690 RepID=A0A1H1YV58_9MICO|nr:aldo/keto reductase [Microterricola viridarii]SDT25351.1 Predicted oxidoreductase [Microterricola viridarii]